MAKSLREKQEIYIYKNLSDVIICIKDGEVRIFADKCITASESDHIRIKKQFQRGYPLRFNLAN